MYNRARAKNIDKDKNQGQKRINEMNRALGHLCAHIG